MDHRFIEDFVDRLIPEAFERRHSASRVELTGELGYGAEDFDDWVRERLLIAIFDRLPDGSRPWLYMEADSLDGVRWRWDGDAPIPPSWLVERVRPELQPIIDPWLFAVHAPGPSTGPSNGPSTGYGADAWHDPSSGLWSLSWYAEARGRGVADVRAGGLDLVGDGIVASYGIELGYGFPREMHRLLHGHPSRKRMPLRRSRR